jgi:hypothetical protein
VMLSVKNFLILSEELLICLYNSLLPVLNSYLEIVTHILMSPQDSHDLL